MGKCKPCSVPIKETGKRKHCKPFSICVGNKTLVWDGDCASIVNRKYQIPDGTFTSITFEGGCIVDVGNAPLPQYTPQACCGGEETNTGHSGNSMSVAEGNNLLRNEGGALTVEPEWEDTKSIKVKGTGSATKPWKAEVKVDPISSNRLVATEKGLKVELNFATSDNVKITGSGTKNDPYKFKMEGANAKLPKLNSGSVLGDGFTIDEQGRLKIENPDKFELLTKLEFTHQAFHPVNQGNKLVVQVDESKFPQPKLTVNNQYFSGNGTTSELSINLQALFSSQEFCQAVARCMPSGNGGSTPPNNGSSEGSGGNLPAWGESA